MPENDRLGFEILEFGISIVWKNIDSYSKKDIGNYL